MTSSDHKEWSAPLRRGLHRAAVSIEESTDLAWRRARDRFGWERPRWIAAYRGYANGEQCWLTGRVLANRPLGGPREDDTWWHNLLNSYRRIQSDELPGVPVRVRIAGEEIETKTDDEGYYRVAHRLAEAPVPAGEWHQAQIEVNLDDGQHLAALHPFLLPSPHAAFGVISDIDDTVLESSVTQLPRLAKLTFLHNARTRKPLAGAGELYQTLHRGDGREPPRPFFYVSSSPWNLYDLIEDFLELNALPAGPLLLRDYGIDVDKFIASSGHGHKLAKAKTLLDTYPDLPFVLIGDSGQEDAQLYGQAIAEHPGRILAVYIRDVDPDTDSTRDHRVDSAIEQASLQGVPMLRVRDSRAIADHAAELGLIPRATVPEIKADAVVDRQRPDLGEAAVES